MAEMNLTSGGEPLLDAPSTKFESELERQCMETYVPSNRSTGLSQSNRLEIIGYIGTKPKSTNYGSQFDATM
ncbi:unnamed protein product [Allacma fusca]|uniref:Uncharacterized protein n=1 Tax=Allacma fusca TaxID=39272 RepID=A0A8J2L018_9HEXA|nr:unnamed protein product [Allacma fusca]